MMSVGQLVERCAAKDSHAWLELWGIVEGTALNVLRALLRNHAFDPSLAEDVLQELFFHLSEDGLRRLRAFRGTTEPEFRLFVRAVALRFGRRIVRRWQRARSHEAMACYHVSQPNRDGPTEEQVDAVRQELQSLMSHAEWLQLGQVSPVAGGSLNGDKQEAAHDGRPLRTVRRWRMELLRKYSDFV